MKNAVIFTTIGLVLLVISQILLSQGYDFLMEQNPIDFAHWFMLLSAVLLFSLWYTLPSNTTKRIGLLFMTVGIAGMVGMCTIDFVLWASHEDPELKQNLFKIIGDTPSIHLPFLVIGPTLFYMGIGVSTYGLFKKYTWQVVTLNIGLLMIGLGHMVLQNHLIPVIGSLFLLVALYSIVRINRK